ncbi:hypothetical protein [Flavobacterium sp.]|uniref:hypothetical protein n=1 Tax=Flavobacterium sp. TaxID=239 RepID=UPI0039E572B9
MKKIAIIAVTLLAIADGLAQTKDYQTENAVNTIAEATTEPIIGPVFPILFMAFLVFMLVSGIKYFLEFRLRNKMIDKGMSEQMLTHLSNKNEDKVDDAIKLALLFSGLGIGLSLTYLAGPISMLSLAIMASSIGLSYFAYFCYLRQKK